MNTGAILKELWCDFLNELWYDFLSAALSKLPDVFWENIALSQQIGLIVICMLLSALWIAGGIQDWRERKISNLLTFPALALAVGYNIRQGWPYLLALGMFATVVLMIWMAGNIGGGDAKLVFSLYAWQPTMDTVTITLLCLVVVGGAVILWKWFRHQRTRTYPLGGAISLAGLIIVWTSVAGVGLQI